MHKNSAWNGLELHFCPISYDGIVVPGATRSLGMLGSSQGSKKCGDHVFIVW